MLQLKRLHEAIPFDSMVLVGDMAYAGFALVFILPQTISAAGVSSEKYKELPVLVLISA